MSTAMTLYINHSIDDQPYGSSGIDWLTVDPNNDYFIFSAGSAIVADEESIPNETDLNRSAVQLSDISDVIVGKYFLADTSENKLKEVKLAGNQNKQYVFCASFDGATASEPQLEAWDDDDMDSYNDVALGNGSPSVSWYRAICTTLGSAGVDWTGIRLAGSESSNIVLLNNGNGALGIATDLYFQFKIVIPAGHDIPATHTPILVITYTTN